MGEGCWCPTRPTESLSYSQPKSKFTKHTRRHGHSDRPQQLQTSPPQTSRQAPRRHLGATHLSPTDCRFARWLLPINSSRGPMSLVRE